MKALLVIEPQNDEEEAQVHHAADELRRCGVGKVTVHAVPMNIQIVEGDTPDRWISGEQLDALGKLADQCENYAAASTLPIRAELHVPELRKGFQELAASIKGLYVDIAGENPWQEGDPG